MTAGCVECGAPLADDQRYCLQCGARHGAPRVDPLAALGFPGDGTSPAVGATTPPAATRSGPSRRLAAGLAAATLVLGALVGAALGPGPTPSPAAAPQRIVALVTPAPASAPATTTPRAPAVDETPSTPASAGSAADPTPATGTGDTAPADQPAAAGDSTPTAADPAASDDTPAASAPAPTAAPHVWIVSLTGLDAAGAFGPDAPLADLVARGTLLRGYVPAGPTPAANGLALLGGQVPAADCAADPAACTLPASEPSLPAQIAGAGRRWKAYIEDPAARAAGPQPRVAVSLFHGLADRADYAASVAGTDALAADLAATATTPELSLVVPAAAGLDAAPAVHDAVAAITASPAFEDNGLLLLLVDAPPAPADPAAPLPAVGALVLSPRATAGRALDTPAGPVALLRSLEDLLALPPLGASAQAPAGALDGVLAPAVASASAASVFPHPPTSTTTRRSN